jgi:cytochrome b subunit of formate dehydrogenase
MSVSQVLAAATLEPSGRVKRHALIDRIYHWLTALSVLVLMGTAFLPILGWKFEWLTLHWTTGVVLAVLVLAHVLRALVWQDWRAMLIDMADIRDAWRAVASVAGGGNTPPGKPGKYKLLQKLYHLSVALLILSIVVSGLLMLLKIDTPFWRRNPYWFAADTWGVVYSIHGFAAMAMITLVMIHIYFALRPEEWWLTRSMLRGWISQAEYRDHCDGDRWKVSETPATGENAA